MREMVLNHASIIAWTGRETTDCLKDIAAGMAQLYEGGVVQAVLRTCIPINEIPCASAYSLFDGIQNLRELGAREEYLFLMGLVTKAPLLEGVGEDLKSRFYACEARTLPPEDGEPLLLCALTDWVSVGFPLDPWDLDRISVSFLELLPDENTVLISEDIDNLARAIHAGPIHEREQARLRAELDLRTLWKKRRSAFPKLAFAPRVESDLKSMNPAFFSAIVKRLTALHTTAEQWQKSQEPVPPWTCHVTDESRKVKERPALREARRFTSHQGTEELFLWHARFGNAGRIHLRFEAQSKEIEIGYIGPHLRL